MPWNVGVFTLYHGTVAPFADAIALPIPGRNSCDHGILPAKGLPNTDFGQGFYVTRIEEHAKQYANQRYIEMRDDLAQGRGTIDPIAAAVIAFFFGVEDLAALDGLAFVQPTPDWHSFVRYCRAPSGSHKANGDFYDTVCGPGICLRGIYSAGMGTNKFSHR